MNALISDPPFHPDDLKLLPGISNKIRFMRAMVVSSSYYRDQILDEIPNLKIKIEIKYRTIAFVNVERKQAWSHLELSIIAFPQDGKLTDRNPFKIDTKFEVRYDASNVELAPEEFQRALNAFCHTASPLHGWSFLRQHIHDAMSRMLLPPLELPLMPAPEIFPTPIPPASSTKPKPSPKKPRRAPQK